MPLMALLDENKKLIVDEETAPVVQMIFQLCAEGNGPGKIARILKERKINTPRTLDFLWTERADHYDPDDPYGWSCATVARILGQKEYLGHTVNFKTTKKSFKSKRFTFNPEDKQMVFENTHEAIINIELWEVVQKIRAHRHRRTRAGETALFSGIIFCYDCGSPLSLSTTHRNRTSYSRYICSKYRNSRGVQKCDAHYINESVLASLVLENLRKVISYVRNYEDEFARQAMDNALAEQIKQQSSLKCQLEQQTRRIGEIDTIIQRLYEDNISGKLTDERFSKMSAAYEKEQRELETSTSELREQVETCEQQKVNVKSFLNLVKSYIEPEQLTPEVLHMFVEKVVVHEPDKSNGHRVQQIDIYYNFVGQLDMSVEVSKSIRGMKAEINAQILSNQQRI